MYSTDKTRWVRGIAGLLVQRVSRSVRDDRDRECNEALRPSVREQGGKLRFLQHLFGRDHGDDIPRTNLRAELATDAHAEVDGANAHRVARMGRIGGFVDAIDWTDGHAGVTSGAKVLVEDGELFGELFLLGHRQPGPCAFIRPECPFRPRSLIFIGGSGKRRGDGPAIPQVGTEVLKVAKFASVLGVGQVRDGRFSRQEAGILRNRE